MGNINQKGRVGNHIFDRLGALTRTLGKGLPEVGDSDFRHDPYNRCDMYH